MRHPLLRPGSFAIAVATALVAGAGACLAAGTGFPDVPDTHPEAWAIRELRDGFAISGFEDGTFRPDALTTRAGVVQVAMQASGHVRYVLGPGEKPTYSDVPATDPAVGFVERAVREGVLQPQGEKPTFRPTATATRVEGLKLVLSAFDITPPPVTSTRFADVQADSWELPYVAFADAHDLLRTTGSAFHPTAPLRRAELARIAARLLDAQRDAQRPLIPTTPAVLLGLGWLLLGLPLAMVWGRGASAGVRASLTLAALLLGPLALLVLVGIRVGRRWREPTVAAGRQPLRRRRSAAVQRALALLDASLLDLLGITVVACYLTVLSVAVQTVITTAQLRASLPPLLHG